MTKPFYERLRNYYAAVGRILRGESDAASIFPNTTDIGMSRERLYAEFLRLHLPSICNVSFGGFLFDQAGNESKQIDLFISDASSLQFNFNNKEKMAVEKPSPASMAVLLLYRSNRGSALPN